MGGTASISTEQGDTAGNSPARLGEIVAGVPQRIGSGFAATHFSEDSFAGRMDPLLMVDHFVMTAPTFEPHLHAGISAVTAMFEDAEGQFHNRDSLGNDLELGAGDLYWLAAAGGAVHEELPMPGARIHALQIFVNLPAALKKASPRTLHVRAAEVPVFAAPGTRVRVVLGSSGELAGAQGTPEEMTLLDGSLGEGAGFSHRLPEGRHAWIYAVSGRLALRCGNEVLVLEAGHATTVAAGPAIAIELEAAAASTHFVLMAAKPIREPFVKHGPLVMSTVEDVRSTLAAYADGRLGRIPG